MECRVGQTPLTPPEIAVAGEQAVAKQFGIGAGGYPFDEVAVLPQQDLFDVLRVEQDVKMDIEEMVVEDVAVLASPARELCRGVAAGHKGGAHKGQPAGAWRAVGP
jgi:hypothetical protein